MPLHHICKAIHFFLLYFLCHPDITHFRFGELLFIYNNCYTYLSCCGENKSDELYMYIIRYSEV